MRSQNLASYAAEFRERGFAVVPNVLAADEIDRLRAAIAAVPESDAVRQKRGVYGVRNLLDVSPEVRELAARPEIRRFVTPVLGESAFATRAVFFDKIPGANWALGWHQDSVIAVAERREVPGFVAWGLEAGVWQVQPPPEILAAMVAVRVHLDDCGPDNGPLRVLPGSHRHGWVEDQLADWKRKVPEAVCTVPAGGVVTMCPLLLHASSKAISPGHRRVIHIEFASQDLPSGLEWHRRIGLAPDHRRVAP
ncbi:MAG TPA: phytanoyl-CoA dioxygenase family protein [Planctomycetaceae bacterium]